MRDKTRRIVSAVAVMAVCLGGCSQNTEDSAYETAAETTKATITLPSVAHDIDIIGEERASEGADFFFVTKELTEKEFYPTENSVRFSGRHIEYENAEYLSYTCSSVDFVLTGDKIEADIVSNGYVFEDERQAWIGLVVDGELVKRVQLEGGENHYVLYDGDLLVNSHVSIIKLSENQMATAGIKNIKVNARKIAPEREKELTIEFVGDSITCGYGNEGVIGDSFDTSKENGMATYAYYTASALNAEMSMVCASGIGVVSDYTDTVGSKEDYQLIDDIYDFADYNFQVSRGQTELKKWDFADGSDIVVINLGTNDFSYTGSNNELMDEFGGGYYELIGMVRERNPHAKIICTLGILGSELYEQVEYAANSYAEGNSDGNIYTFKFSYQDEDDGYGTAYHPTVATHEKAAAELTDYINSIL